MSMKSDDPYDIMVTQDPADPTLIHVSMKLPASMVARCEPGLIDLPENPTIQFTEEARKRLSDALADWMTRGNMRHEGKSDPRLPTPEEFLTPEEIEEERIKVLGRTPEEIAEERAKAMAEAKERAAKLARATVKEQLEFVKKAVELGCHKYIGEPTYVGTFPERQDIPVEPKAPHPDKKVEPGALSGTFSKVFEAVYRSDAPDDVVYEVVGKLLRAGITEPTPEVVEAMFRSVLNRRKDP